MGEEACRKQKTKQPRKVLAGAGFADILNFGSFRNIVTIEHHQSVAWVMAQVWDDLLFAHWPLDPGQLERFVRPPLRLDTHAGHAWLGVVAFRISRIQLRGLPVVPAVSDFPEVNLRTYVRLNDRPGVLFLSLHCPNRLAMALARPWFRLPYRHAAVCLRRGRGATEFASHGPEHADFAAAFAPTSAACNDDSLGRWLTERYCYYAQTERATYRCDISHVPWPLTEASASITSNSLAEPFGLRLPASEPILHAASHMDTRVWPIRRVA
jgi:uncharacterized protein YqjF (DUF2071 family)